MSSKSKKEAKSGQSGRGGATQSSKTDVPVQEKEKGSRKLSFHLGSKKKPKDGEKLLPDKDKRRGKGGSGSKGGKGEAETDVVATVSELEGSPGLGRHGLAQAQMATAKTPPEGLYYPPEALKPISGVSASANTGGFASMGGFDKLEPHPLIAQEEAGAAALSQNEFQELIDLRKSAAQFGFERKRLQKEKDDLEKLVKEYEGHLADLAAKSGPFIPGEGGKAEELKKKNIQLEEELALLREESSSIQEQKNSAEAEVANVKEKLTQEVLHQSQLAEEATREKRDLEEKLHEIEEKLTLTTEKHHDEVEQEKCRLLNESKDVINKLQETEKEAMESANQVVKLSEKLEQNELQHQSLLADLEKERVSCVQLRNQLREMEKLVHERDKQLQVKEEEAVGFAKQLANAERELVTLKTSVQEVEKEAVDSANQVVNLAKKLEEKDLQHQAILAKLRNQLEESETKVGECIRSHEEERAKLLQQLQNANEENARLGSQLQEKRTEVTRKVQQLEATQKASMEMERQMNALREEHLHCQLGGRQDELGMLLEGQDGAGASPHSSLTEHQKMEEWRELLDAKDVKIEQLQKETDRLRAELDNEKLMNSLLDKTTKNLEAQLGTDQSVPKMPEEVPDRFQKLLHTQGPVARLTRSTSSPPDLVDRDAMQTMEKKLEDEIKLRTALEQEVFHLRDQLGSVKGMSKKECVSPAAPPVAVQPNDAFSLGMAARIQESEENMQASAKMASEPQTEFDKYQQDFWAQMERQSHHILTLREEIKNKNMHLEISEEQLETARKEIQDLVQQVESLKAQMAASGGQGKQDSGRTTGGAESIEHIREELIKSQRDVEYLQGICHEKEKALEHWRSVAEHNKHTVENLGKTIVELKAEKSQMEELQGEWSEKITQLEEMKETLAVREESLVVMEEQVSSLLKEKDEVQRTLQDREREVGRVRDELECVKMQAVMYEEDFQQERRDREKAHGMLEDLRGQLSYEKNVLQTQLRDCHATITQLRSQVEDSSRKTELLHENERLQRDLLALGEERDTALQQVRSYKLHSDGYKRQLEDQQKLVESLQQQLEHLAEVETIANNMMAEREHFEKHMQSQKSASAADRRRSERLQKEVEELVLGKERLEQEITKMKSSNVILQKRLKETRDQKTELEERLRHLQFSQSQQQHQQCSHRHDKEGEPEQSPAAIGGMGEEMDSHARRQNKHELAMHEQQVQREQQEAWMENLRQEQQRLQSEAAYCHQQPSALAPLREGGHQQFDQAYFQEQPQPRIDPLPHNRQAAMLKQPSATGGRMLTDHSNQPAFTPPSFSDQYRDSQGPQSITFGSYSRPPFDPSYKLQMSVEAPAAIGVSTPYYSQDASNSWRQRKHQTHALGSVSPNSQTSTFLEQEARSRLKAAEHHMNVLPAEVQSHDMSSGQLVTAGGSPSPTSRLKPRDPHPHEPAPIAEQSTGFSAQDFLGGMGALEVKDEGDKRRGGLPGEPGQGKSDNQVYEIPLDPNLVCPKCRKGFRHGEIQRLKVHFEGCDGQK